MKREKLKEDWINGVLDSIGEIAPVQPSPYLFQKVMLRLETETRQLISLRVVWMSAAAVLALIVLNIAAIKIQVSKSGAQDASIVVSEYQLNADPSSLFEI
jgi:hypothetical protein